MEKNNLKFEFLDISNFKNISRKTLEINGRSFIILGKNGAGKSSLIQALLSPLNTKVIADVPVLDGEEHAKIEVRLGGTVNGVKKSYTMEMYFNSKTQKGKLVLLNDQGEKIASPAGFVKSLIGDISFDVMEFINAGKAEKIKILRELTGKDQEITLADREIKKAKDEKAYLEKREVEVSAFVSEHNLSQEQIKKYEEPIPVAAIQEKLRVANETKETFQKGRNFVANKTNDFKNKEQRIIDIEKKINELNAEKEILNAETIKISTEIENATEWLQTNVEPNTTEIIQEMNDAMEHNNEFNKIQEIAKKHGEINEIRAGIKLAENNVKKAIEKRDKIIRDSALPVEGLTWTDDEILVDGRPFDDKQMNKSRIFEIGMKMTRAMNPNLKTIFLHDASLFDTDHLNTVIKEAEEAGYQVIAEKVMDGTDLQVDFIEA